MSLSEVKQARGRRETGRARHAARAGRADDPRRGRSASRSACAPTRAPRRRSRRTATDLGKLSVAGAAEDRGRRQEHGREDPRAASRPARSRSSRACAPSTRPPWWRCCASRASGPKAVKRLRAELGVQSIDDLRRVLAEHKLRDLKGFGAEVGGEAGPVAGAPRRSRASIGRTPISVALPLARAHRRAPAEVPGVTHASYCGSLRRFSRDHRRRRHRGRRRAIRSRSWTRWSRCRRSTACSGAATPRPASSRGAGRRSTCAWSRPHQLGAALLYFTGSKGHNIKLRQRALARGLDAERVRAVRARRRQGHRQRDRGGDLRGARPAVHPAGAARGRGRDRGRRERRAAAADRRRLRRLPRAHDGVGRRALVARGGGRGGASRAATACWPSPITPRGRCRASAATRSLEQRARIRAHAGPAGRRADAAPRRRAEHRPDGRARLRPRVPPRRSTGAWPRCTTTSISTAPRRPGAIVTAMQDPTVRMIGHLSARMIGGAPAHRAGSRRDVRRRRGDRHGAGGQRRACRAWTCRSRRCAAARGRNVTFVLTSDAHEAGELERVRYADAQRRARLAGSRARRQRLGRRPPDRLAGPQGPGLAGAGLIAVDGVAPDDSHG